MSIQDSSRYYSCARLSFLKLLVYRMRYFTGIITYLLFVSVHYFIWQAVFSNKPYGSLINGFTFPEIITYVSVGWIARSLYFSDIDEEIAEMVKSGQISIYLLRPVKFHFVMLAEAFGGFVFRLILFTIPISIVLLYLFPILPPKSITHAIFFILSTFASFFVLAEINFLLGLLCFVLKSIDGFMRAKYFFIQFFSGLLLPLSFFPLWAREILEVLPFRLIAATPLEIYLGKINGTNLIWVVLFTLFWGLSLFILSEIFSKMAFRRLSIQGG